MQIKEKYPWASFSIETLRVENGTLVLHHKSLWCAYTKEIPLKELDPCYLKVKQGSVGAIKWMYNNFLVNMVLFCWASASRGKGIFPLILSAGVAAGLLTVSFAFLGFMKRKEYANFSRVNGQYAFSVDMHRHAEFAEKLKEEIENVGK